MHAGGSPLSRSAYSTVDRQTSPLQAWNLHYNRAPEANTSPYFRCRAGRNELLIPCEGTNHRASLALYQPDTWKGQALKTVVATALKRSWPAWPLERVYLRIDSLVQLVEHKLGVSNVSLAFRLSTPTNCRKLIGQAISQSGEVLAIVKLPLTSGAVNRVRNEARTIARLNAEGKLVKGIPRLLYAAEFENSFVLIETLAPANATASPTSFEPMHRKFLESLHTVSPSVCTGSQLLLLISKEGARSRELSDFKCLLDRLHADIGEEEVDCSLTHGDFAPWNMRAVQGDLYAFDWESATDSRPTLWDEFHFRTQTAALLSKDSIHISPRRRSLYALYLLDSLIMLEQEESPDANGLEYRRNALRSLLKEMGA